MGSLAELDALERGIVRLCGFLFLVRADRGLRRVELDLELALVLLPEVLALIVLGSFLLGGGSLGLRLGLFDLLVIDLLWWRSTKRIRFSFLPEKKYYQDPKKHIESFLHGMPLFAAIAALTALIVTVL